mmetsp:Transcript_108600/g.221737  ORF Transcript_108600/g.221737 Transcript_108600/m.221737 type:complete len:207 (-) Transcript_108600:519-1139(-)
MTSTGRPLFERNSWKVSMARRVPEGTTTPTMESASVRITAATATIAAATATTAAAVATEKATPPIGAGSDAPTAGSRFRAESTGTRTTWIPFVSTPPSTRNATSCSPASTRCWKQRNPWPARSGPSIPRCRHSSTKTTAASSRRRTPSAISVSTSSATPGTSRNSVRACWWWARQPGTSKPAAGNSGIRSWKNCGPSGCSSGWSPY